MTKQSLMVLPFLFFVNVLLADADLIQKKYEQMIYPIVRITSISETVISRGSGTIIFNEDREKDGNIKTFILTNHHVIASSISIEKKWNSLKQAFCDTEVCEDVIVEVFNYNEDGKENGRTNYDAKIVAYDSDEDLALIQLNASVKIAHIAKLSDPSQKFRMFDKVFAVGCPLGELPMPTEGQVTGLSKMIERKSFWSISANIAYGNSGGAVFAEKDNDFYFIGVPSRVASSGFQIIPYMAYIIPMDRINNWFSHQKLDFLLDKNKTPTECLKDRKTK